MSIPQSISMFVFLNVSWSELWHSDHWTFSISRSLMLKPIDRLCSRAAGLNLLSFKGTSNLLSFLVFLY